MFKKILVPIDGSTTADLALAKAIELAKAFDAQLRLIHVVDEMAYPTGYDQFGGYSGALTKAMREAGQRVLDDAMKVAIAAAVKADSQMFDKFGAHLAETVADAARLWGADLLIVGTHGRRGMGRFFMGSGAEQILRLAPVPVLVIRSPAAPSVPLVPQAASTPAAADAAAEESQNSVHLLGT